MTRTVLVLALAAAAAGCIDFADPEVLGLARPARLEMFAEIVTGDAPIDCAALPGFGPVGARAPASIDAAAAPVATLCVRARLEPGRDKFAVRRRVPDPTMLLFGDAVEPVVTPDSALEYRYGRVLPADSLDEIGWSADLPEVVGVPLGGERLRWPLVGQGAPRRVEREPGGDLVFQLQPPATELETPPNFQSWELVVSGSEAVATVRGGGVPRTRYAIPSDISNTVGTPRDATLRFTQRLITARGEQVLLSVSIVQRVNWTIAAPADPTSSGS